MKKENENKVNEVEELTEEQKKTDAELKIKRKKLTVKNMARIAIFGAISAILYCVPIFQFRFIGFLEFHFDEIPALLAGFAYDPIVAFFIILVRTLIKLPMSSTLCVGELSDFIYSVAFILPASYIYKKHRTFKGALVSLAVGFVAEIIMSAVMNRFVMIDFYMTLFGLEAENIFAIFSKLGVDSMNSLIFKAIMPFNAIKNIIVVVFTFLIYKPLHKLISKKNW